MMKPRPSDGSSVMKQPDARVRHRQAVFIACMNDLIIAVGTAWLYHECNPRLIGTIDGIAKGNIPVRCQNRTSETAQPVTLLLA